MDISICCNWEIQVLNSIHVHSFKKDVQLEIVKNKVRLERESIMVKKKYPSLSEIGLGQGKTFQLIYFQHSILSIISYL